MPRFRPQSLHFRPTTVENIKNITDIQKLSGIQGQNIQQKISQWQTQIVEMTEKKYTKALLEIENLAFHYPYNQRAVLDQLNLKIYQGEMLSLVGENGAGKSTISKLICGFYAPASGEIKWQGRSLLNESIKERAEKIGYIMQNPNQMISQNKIFDEVALGLVNRGWQKEAIKEKVWEILEVCGLYPFRSWPISALSYGQKKRVTIASILVLEPELLILDEPTAGQDFKNYTEMMHFLEKLNQNGKTILMITHDMHLMLEYTERTLVLKKGQVVVDASPYEVLTNKKIVKDTALKETSLFTLAEQLNLAHPVEFVEKFIQQERKERGR